MLYAAHVAALEDKIVQRATVTVLNAIYEEDFLGFSYGFRRSQHDALDALVVGISSTKVNYILDADIAGFFDAVSQDWLVRFLNHRIGDAQHPVQMLFIVMRRRLSWACSLASIRLRAASASAAAARGCIRAAV